MINASEKWRLFFYTLYNHLSYIVYLSQFIPIQSILPFYPPYALFAGLIIQ